MSYWLGIDVGTAYTAAALWRDGRAAMVDLGTHAPVVPSVALLRDDGEVLVGEAAERRAVTEPERVARAFKRRLGDPTAIVLAGTPISAEVLTSHLLRWTAEQAAALEGGPPAGVVVTHPANWREYKQDVLRRAVRQADLGEARLLTEPEAAAIHYAAQERLPAGAAVAVYDLGGGTFDASVLRKAEHGWDLLGRPEGIERLGGVDVDEALYQHVVSTLGDAVEQLDPDDPAAVAAVARLRRECVEAKEALASDSPVTIPVLLPSVDTEVRITRGELEGLIRPVLSPTVDALRRALRSADVEAGDLHAVLLVGGSSRLPLVAELVSAELGRPIALDMHPKHGVALGAATVAAAAARPAPEGDDGAIAAPGVVAGAVAAAAGRAATGDEAGDPAAVDGAPTEVADGGANGAADGVAAMGAGGAGAETAGAATARDGAGEDATVVAETTEPLPVAGRAAPSWPPPAPAPISGGEPDDTVHDGGATADGPAGARSGGRSRALVGALATAAILVVGSGVAVALNGGGGDREPQPPPASSTTTTEPPTTTTTTAPTTTAPPTTEAVVVPPSTAPPVTEPPPTTEPPTTTSSTTTTTTATTTTSSAPDDPGATEEAAEPTGAEPVGGES